MASCRRIFGLLDTPAEVVAYYLAAGYGALAITDHNMVTTQGTGISLAISGNEVNHAAPHIISMNNSYTKGSDTTAQQFIDGIVAAGGHAQFLLVAGVLEIRDKENDGLALLHVVQKTQRA